MTDLETYIRRYRIPRWEIGLVGAFAAYRVSETAYGRVLIDEGGYRAEWKVPGQPERRKTFKSVRGAISQVMLRCEPYR